MSAVQVNSGTLANLMCRSLGGDVRSQFSGLALTFTTGSTSRRMAPEQVWQVIFLAASVVKRIRLIRLLLRLLALLERWRLGRRR